MQIRQISLIITAVIMTGALVYILSSGTTVSDPTTSRTESVEEMKEGEILSSDDSDRGKLFNEKTIDWEAVRSAIPDNRAPMTREESEDFRENRSKLQALRAKITSNKANAEEIDSYYREQTEITRDMIEFYGYLLKDYDSRLEERTLKKYTFLKEQFEYRLARIPRKKEESVKRITEYRQKKGLVK